MVGGAIGNEFHASERASHGSMDDLFSEETRGERPTTVAPPGRTYECEVKKRLHFLKLNDKIFINQALNV